MEKKHMTLMTAHEHNNYIEAIQEALNPLPVDGAALLTALVAFDDGLQNARLKSSLSQYTRNRLTSTDQLGIINDALSQL
jgi:hypothetical protein